MQFCKKQSTWERGQLFLKTANNTLHLTAIPLRSIAAGELVRYRLSLSAIMNLAKLKILPYCTLWFGLP